MTFEPRKKAALSWRVWNTRAVHIGISKKYFENTVTDEKNGVRNRVKGVTIPLNHGNNIAVNTNDNGDCSLHVRKQTFSSRGSGEIESEFEVEEILREKYRCENRQNVDGEIFSRNNSNRPSSAEKTKLAANAFSVVQKNNSHPDVKRPWAPTPWIQTQSKTKHHDHTGRSRPSTSSSTVGTLELEPQCQTNSVIDVAKPPKSTTYATPIVIPPHRVTSKHNHTQNATIGPTILSSELSKAKGRVITLCSSCEQVGSHPCKSSGPTVASTATSTTSITRDRPSCRSSSSSTVFRSKSLLKKHDRTESDIKCKSHEDRPCTSIVTESETLVVSLEQPGPEDNVKDKKSSLGLERSKNNSENVRCGLESELLRLSLGSLGDDPEDESTIDSVRVLEQLPGVKLVLDTSGHVTRLGRGMFGAVYEVHIYQGYHKNNEKNVQS